MGARARPPAALGELSAIRRTKPRDKQERSSRTASSGPVEVEVEVEVSEADVKVAQSVREVDGVPVDPGRGDRWSRARSRASIASDIASSWPSHFAISSGSGCLRATVSVLGTRREGTTSELRVLPAARLRRAVPGPTGRTAQRSAFPCLRAAVPTGGPAFPCRPEVRRSRASRTTAPIGGARFPVCLGQKAQRHPESSASCGPSTSRCPGRWLQIAPSRNSPSGSGRFHCAARSSCRSPGARSARSDR